MFPVQQQVVLLCFRFNSLAALSIQRHQMYHQIYVRECGCVRGCVRELRCSWEGVEVEVDALELDELK